MIPDLPGWDSLPTVTRYHNWAEMAGIFAVAFLVIAEIVSYKYGHRKDDLTEQQQTATNQRHDEEMARLHLETAKIQERSAKLEKEAAEAQLSLGKLQTPRAALLTDAALNAIAEKLKPFADTKFDTGLAANSGE